MNYIINPILKGFNPDPSILRVGADYYIATSTFQWFPGIQIYHSKDLKNWKLVAHPLSRMSQLDMKGNPDSGGVYAPSLSHSNGTFYLIYTNVKSFGKGIFSDSHNYLVTSTDICGKWSEPIYLHSTGYDPSMFHNSDGRKWILSALVDHRPWKKYFAGIVLQEYSEKEQKLVGESIKIFEGTELGITEGPNLYKKDGYYYLVTAEGGTFQGHAVTLARSKDINGPYEVGPYNPILTSANDCMLELQRCGHASLVETQGGEWYMVHLCGRPLPSRGRCMLGRETAVQKVIWTDDNWLKLAHGGNKPLMKVPSPDLQEFLWENEPEMDDFDLDKLNINFQTLRIPLGEDMLSLKERQGYLRLKGKESLSSLFRQSLVARRQQSFCYTAQTCIEFEPESFKQMAGLICVYDTSNFYYLHISYDEELGKYLNILNCDNGKYVYPIERGISIDGLQRCYLRAKVQFDKLEFYFSKDEMEWTGIGVPYDASIMSDEYYEYNGEMRFTGAFIGMCCQDLSGQNIHADFDYFEYSDS